MTHHIENKVRKFLKVRNFLSFAKTFGSKYGKALKKEGLKVGKLAGKQLSEKIIPAAVDLAGSNIADEITSLKMSSDQEPQEELEE